MWSIWSEPFPREIWLCLGIALLLIISFAGRQMLVRVRTSQVIFCVVACFMRNGLPACVEPFLATLFLQFFGMFVSTLYENEITSILTVPPGLLEYKSLSDLIDANYKILYNENINNPAKTMYDDFVLRGLENKINQSFMIRSEIATNLSRILQHLMSSESYLKYVVCPDTEEADSLKLSFEVYINEIFKRKTYECRTIKEELQSEASYTRVFTPNRFWMLISHRRIQEAGLGSYWGKYSNWLDALQLQVDKGKYSEKSFLEISTEGFIGLKDLIIVWTTTLILLLVAASCFLASGNIGKILKSEYNNVLRWCFLNRRVRNFSNRSAKRASRKIVLCRWFKNKMCELLFKVM